MTDTEIRAVAEAFVALPRAERRAKYFTLSKEVQRRVRKMIEGRRGIAYRAEGGAPVFTKDEYVRQLTKGKQRQMVATKRAETLNEHMVELKAQLLETYGQEALDEAELALEAVEAEYKQ